MGEHKWEQRLNLPKTKITTKQDSFSIHFLSFSFIIKQVGQRFESRWKKKKRETLFGASAAELGRNKQAAHWVPPFSRWRGRTRWYKCNLHRGGSGAYILQTHLLTQRSAHTIKRPTCTKLDPCLFDRHDSKISLLAPSAELEIKKKWKKNKQLTARWRSSHAHTHTHTLSYMCDQ